MHLPYVRKIFEGYFSCSVSTRFCFEPTHRQDIKIVPIVVGSISQFVESHYGQIIAPYLAEPDTFCVVSSDFCHWFAIPCTRPSSTYLRSSLGARDSHTHSTIQRFQAHPTTHLATKQDLLSLDPPAHPRSPSTRASLSSTSKPPTSSPSPNLLPLRVQSPHNRHTTHLLITSRGRRTPSVVGTRLVYYWAHWRRLRRGERWR